MTLATQVLAVAGLLAGGLCLGEEARQHPADSGYVVEKWEIDAGLPHNCVTAIEQTQDGYLWIGTSNGLARFDGARFTAYRSADHAALRDNRILSLHQDRQAGLWVGTEEGGLSRFAQGEFVRAAAEALSSQPVLAIGHDRLNNLWVGTAAGLYRAGLDGAFFQGEALSGDPVYCMLPSRSRIVIGTRNGLFELRQDRIQLYEGPGANVLRTNAFLCLDQGAERRFWAGSSAGLFRLGDSNQFSFLQCPQFGSGPVVAVLETTEGAVWFGTGTGDLFVAPAASQPIEPRLVAKLPRAPTTLRQDNEGNLWVGTRGSGLFRLKPRQLRWVAFPQEVNEQSTAAALESNDGRILLLARDHSVYESSGDGFVLSGRLKLPEGVAVQTVCADAKSNLWLGTRSDGLFRISGDRVTKFTERDGLSDSEITALFASQQGVWTATRNGGLNLLSDGKVTRFNTPWGFRGACACVMELDRQGTLWVGTTGDGLFSFSQGRFTEHTLSGEPASRSVNVLRTDPSGSVWIGTLEGFWRYKDGRGAKFPSPNRGQEEAIMQIHDDFDGNIWVGSSSGLYRYRKDQLNDFADGKTGFLDVVPYGREDGLPALQYVPKLATMSGVRGTVLCAATRGLVTRSQPRLQLNTDPPPVILEAVLLGGEPVDIGTFVNVPPGTPSLQFQFTAPSLTAPGKVAFRYLLEGLDAEWSEVAAHRVARYPRLTPGRYTFRVVARNNDGVWNETGASVGIVVLPFWWETLWFRIGALLVVGFGIAGLYRMRLGRQREIERLRIKIASDLHDDVGSSLWSITLLSRMLLTHKSTFNPEEHQDITEINRIAVHTSNSIRDIIWLINPAFDSMQELVLRMKDSALTMLKGVDYSFESDGVDLSRKLPQHVRQNMLLLFKEALTNIAKHAQATRVEVRIEESPGHWKVRIKDDGVGFDIKTRTGGSGLTNMRMRAGKIGSGLDISSAPGQGTTLSFEIVRPGARRTFLGRPELRG